MKYKNIREEELKNKVAADLFKSFDATEIIGNIDFTVFPKQDNLFGKTPLLWAEAKTGDYNISTMFVQLILTIGKTMKVLKYGMMTMMTTTMLQILKRCIMPVEKSFLIFIYITINA